MYQENLIARTRLSPPRPYSNILHRRRITERLLDTGEHRLAILQAGTGYGKTTALTSLGDGLRDLAWYHIDADDAEPQLFLLHLVHALDRPLKGLSAAPMAMLERWESQEYGASWMAVVDILVNELSERLEGPLFLVLDDVHYLNKAADSLRILDRFIALAPDGIHPILATRYPLQLPGLVNWRVRGELLEIGQEELAFNQDEIATLFQERFEHALSQDQVETLFTRVEGWPIALQMVWQRLQSGRGKDFDEALGVLSGSERPGSAGDLFIFLAQEVLAQQADDIQSFLKITSILRKMTAPSCDCLRSAEDSDQILRYLLENELFVVDLGDSQVRYHHVFHDFLSHQLGSEERQQAHLKAAACYNRLDDDQEALFHLLAGRAYDQAAALMVDLGQGLIRAGRLDGLWNWIGALPPQFLEDYPPLMAYLGDIARLQSRFDEALGWYRQAEERCRAVGNLPGIGQALRGQARVYLDTVNPSQAERLLQEALRLSDGQEDRESRARLLDLWAENLLNRGRMEEAASYRDQARELREEGPAEAELSVRLLLRTGRLAEARRLLEERADIERREPVLRPRAHRETLLLLSLVLAFQGERESAYECALEGTERGRALQSSWITAVGHMRQGHTWLMQKDEAGFVQAIECFQEAIQLSEKLEVPRLSIEAYWGMCQAYGFQGDLDFALKVAEKGIAIAQSVGDGWIEAGIRLVLGAGYALAGRHAHAATWLERAAAAFRDCSDRYGETVTRLWQCLIWHESGDKTRLRRDVADLLRLVREYQYAFLFRVKTLLGPPDLRALVPILLFSRDGDDEANLARTLLSQMDLEKLTYHPGYQLRVQMLGSLRVWRGKVEITPEAWRRRKARQLFLLLLTHRQSLLERDQIVDSLWPDLGPEEGQRDFKIAMSALYSVLEPDRGRNTPSAYVVRDGTRYGLRPEADLWLDAAGFDNLIAEGNQLLQTQPAEAANLYRQALALYQGEFLCEFPYEEWCSEERERLLALYLRTAERLAQLLAEEEAWRESIDACELILARDNCWENAYRLMMVAYQQLGERAQALRVYRRCLNNLRRELDVEPTPATTAIYQSLLSGQAPT